MDSEKAEHQGRIKAPFLEGTLQPPVEYKQTELLPSQDRSIAQLIPCGCQYVMHQMQDWNKLISPLRAAVLDRMKEGTNELPSWLQLAFS